MIAQDQMHLLATVALMLVFGCSREPAAHVDDAPQRVASTRTSDKVVGVYEAPHLVASAETADKFVGEVVALVGEAVNGKTPNVRVTSDFHVVCVGYFQFKEMPGRQVFDWPKDILGTHVERPQQDPAAGWSATACCGA
ncbi:MAG: hypothetical protein NTU94_05775 [Planctomycetota bacterium]|nr:hypothetical protein [Planctomycetota bacterium]